MKTNPQLALPLDSAKEDVQAPPGRQKVAPRRPPEIGGGDERSLPSPAETRKKALQLAARLGRRLCHDVHVAVTDNRSSLITARWEERDCRYLFRVHLMFLEADEGTMDALADFGSGRRRKAAGKALDAFIERNRELIRKDPAAGPREPAAAKGRHHDLQEIFERLNWEYFQNKVAAKIGWGESRGHGRRRRSIKMGSYVHDARLIRIHPALDRAEVPEFYVAWVVFHEMLHQVVPPVRRNGRTYFHPEEFKRKEKIYRESARAQSWEDLNFDLLLRG